MRQPLEGKIVTISRAPGSQTFPANFVLIATMNLWGCGAILLYPAKSPQTAKYRLSPTIEDTG
jgi:predicted ATPase with chaperone activity